jgi:hypothetical protein
VTENASLRKVLELGPTAQPTVAGLYAWAVTVAPAGYAPQGPRGTHSFPAAAFATLAFVSLVGGAAADVVLRRSPKPSPGAVELWRTATLLAFAAACLVTWICNTDALSPVRLSAARGVAGMLGWGLFAFAFAAPVVEPEAAPARVASGARARGHVEKGDALFVAAVAALALLLQLVGWNVQSPERAVLVRVATLGAGILLFGGIGTFVSTRHGAAREPARGKARPRAPLPLGWVVAVALLLAAGLLYVLTG